MRTIPLTGANQQLVTVSSSVPFATLRGFTIRETSGVAVALVRIWDGTSATGTILDEVSLAANESAREDYGDPAPTARIGIFLQVVAGAVAGSARLD